LASLNTPGLLDCISGVINWRKYLAGTYSVSIVFISPGLSFFLRVSHAHDMDTREEGFRAQKATHELIPLVVVSVTGAAGIEEAAEVWV
jgi:hypothetical protein